MLYRTPLRMLGDLVSPKALERILESGAAARGKSLADLNHSDLADILKRDVFKRLQLSVPAPLAKKRVQEVLDALEQDSLKNTAIRNEDAILDALEASAKRFSLYFDWPEAQKLRALIGVARQEMDNGKSVPGLLDEGMGLVAGLERRLNEGLVQQASELAELKAEMKRFVGVGGPKVRRLETLLTQIEDAQRQDTLSPAELERARTIALDLRKLVESSVITADVPQEEMPDIALLPAEAQQRIHELDREAEARQLQDMARENEALLRARPDLAAGFAELQRRSATGDVLGPLLAALKETFRLEFARVLEEQREQVKVLTTRLNALAPGAARDEAHLALEIARGTLQGGVLATDELTRLSGTIGTLERQATESAERTEQLLKLQRDLFELETSARGVRGAETELAPHIQAARDRIARGELVQLDDLWGMLERRMGQLAQERESIDARAERVIQEYDQYRHLAGETIQQLGRLADNLRRVRDLGQLSIDTRSKYEASLLQAEALLGEARAEFEAARELTSTFGADALSDLLGVFDGGGALGDLFGGAGNAAPATPAFPKAPVEPLAMALEGLAASGGAQLALIRAGSVTWGNLDAVSTQAAQDLASAASRLSGATLASLELEDGGLLAMPISGAVLVARVEDTASFASWREQLLEARRALA